MLAYGKKDFVAKRGVLHKKRRIGLVYRKTDCSCKNGKTYVLAYREIRECELSSPFLNVINVKV